MRPSNRSAAARRARAIRRAASCAAAVTIAASTLTIAAEEGKMTGKTEHKHTNELVHATSPYLLQHAHNPVDWREWSDESLKKAQREDKPIFLSIGYSACHWCHVMEHESFEDEEVAAVLNEHFVNIKVDREERPDIDEIYMAYTQQATGGGGWPMSVFLTPEGTPFYAGTYFPKQQFLGLSKQIAELWSGSRENILAGTERAKQFFDHWAAHEAPAGMPERDLPERLARTIYRYFDKTLGGISGGGTNKFPPSMSMDLMLRTWKHTSDPDLLHVVDLTLDQMSRGGIYDHIGGGICRYSTDIEWLVPHFEKMLYDQAMVSAIYIDGYLATKNDQYANVARDMFDYVIRDLQSPGGGFYSSRDADSEGLEGKFYLFTVEQIEEILGKEGADTFCAFYDITPSGNWVEHRGHAQPGPKNILRIQTPARAFAEARGLDPNDFRTKLAEWEKKVFDAREKRIHPGLDDKVLTGWNGLMIAAMAEGGAVLGEKKYVDAAAKAADFVLEHMRTPEGRLLRTWRGGKAKLTGYLSDYSFFISGLLNLYEATFDQRWLNEALALTELANRYYYDEATGGYFFTAADGEQLIARSKNPRDGAIPSGNSVMAMNLLRLGVLTGDADHRERAESIFRAFASDMERTPGAFERLACALDFYYDKVKEIVIIGERGEKEAAEMLRAARTTYLPNKVVVMAGEDEAASSASPLLKGKKKVGGKPTAYVCENYRCKLPVTSAEDLRKQLAE